MVELAKRASKLKCILQTHTIQITALRQSARRALKPNHSISIRCKQIYRIRFPHFISSRLFSFLFSSASPELCRVLYVRFEEHQIASSSFSFYLCKNKARMRTHLRSTYMSECIRTHTQSNILTRLTQFLFFDSHSVFRKKRARAANVHTMCDSDIRCADMHTQTLL